MIDYIDMTVVSGRPKLLANHVGSFLHEKKFYVRLRNGQIITQNGLIHMLPTDTFVIPILISIEDATNGS